MLYNPDTMGRSCNLCGTEAGRCLKEKVQGQPRLPNRPTIYVSSTLRMQMLNKRKMFPNLQICSISLLQIFATLKNTVAKST